MKKFLTAVLVVGSMAISSAICAQDFDKGMKALETKDYPTALKEWRYLAERGEARAQNKIGFMYHFGFGVIQDYNEAMAWYRRAAEQGNDDAQFNIGFMYELGDGVLKDKVYTHMWWNIAASNGNRSGSLSRDAIAKTMTPAEIAKAQELARECVKKHYKGC